MVPGPGVGGEAAEAHLETFPREAAVNAMRDEIRDPLSSRDEAS